jgi:nucleoside 2-deoxyribosyltransferase
MRIYLACTVRGDRSGLEAARLAATRLTALGHEVLTTHLLHDDVDRAEADRPECEVFARDVAWLESCDALVAEASGSTYGVGFEVGYVLGRATASGQKVCLLYDGARRNSVSRLISGNTRCHTLAYHGLEEVAAFLEAEFGIGSRRE